MAGHAAELDLDRKRLKRRLGFLQGRVRWHDLQIASERDLKRADLHIACAAIGADSATTSTSASSSASDLTDTVPTPQPATRWAATWGVMRS